MKIKNKDKPFSNADKKSIEKEPSPEGRMSSAIKYSPSLELEERRLAVFLATKEENTPELFAALKDEDAVVRQDAVRNLSTILSVHGFFTEEEKALFEKRIGKSLDEAFTLIVSMINDRDHRVREEAVDGIARMRMFPKDSSLILREVVESQDHESIRAKAVLYLGLFNIEGNFEFVLEQLNDHSQAVVENAIVCIGSYMRLDKEQADKAIEGLKKLLSNKKLHEDIKDKAEWALDRFQRGIL